MHPPISKRNRKYILISISLLALLFPCQPGSAKHVGAQSDNSGRQIAAVIPGMPHPITITVPSMPSPASIKHKETTPIIQTEGRTTTITVPKSLEEAADAAWVAGNKVVKTSYQKIMEVWKWLAAWYKQNHSMPMATPVGSPYVQGPVNHSHQLYFTNEGRLKTVVKH